jgi:hypothetical protein
MAEPLALAAPSDATVSVVAASCCAAGKSRLRLPPLLLYCTAAAAAAAVAVVLLSSLSLAAAVTARCDADCSGALLSLLLLRADVGRETLLRGALM